MQNSPSKSRSERAASIKTSRFDWQRWIDQATSLDLLTRASVLLAAGVLLSLVLRGWEPPFPYRIGYVPQRAIPARIPFQIEDDVQTDGLRVQAAREVLCVYENRKEPLVQLRGSLQDALFALRDHQNQDDFSELQLASLDLFGSQPEGSNTIALEKSELIDCIKIACPNGPSLHLGETPDHPDFPRRP